MLRASDGSAVEGDDPLGLKLFEKEDFQPSLNAAGGVLRELHGYSIADAHALIRAHAFATDRSVASVADEVLSQGELP